MKKKTNSKEGCRLFIRVLVNTMLLSSVLLTGCEKDTSTVSSEVSSVSSDIVSSLPSKVESSVSSTTNGGTSSAPSSAVSSAVSSAPAPTSSKPTVSSKAPAKSTVSKAPVASKPVVSKPSSNKSSNTNNDNCGLGEAHGPGGQTDWNAVYSYVDKTESQDNETIKRAKESGGSVTTSSFNSSGSETSAVDSAQYESVTSKTIGSYYGATYGCKTQKLF